MVARPEEFVDALPAVRPEHEPDVRKAAMLQHPSEEGRSTLFDVDSVGIEVPQKPAELSGTGVMASSSPPSPRPLAAVASAFAKAKPKDVEAVLESLASLGLLVSFDAPDGRHWPAASAPRA